MKTKYKTLISTLTEFSDCFTIQIEAYEKLNIVQDSQLRKIFQDNILPHLDEQTNIEKEYIKFQDRYFKNKQDTEKNEDKIIKEIISFKEDILFKFYSFEYGAVKYNQQSRNLVIGFKITQKTKKYLLQVNNIFDWYGSYPSDLSFYSEGKCIFTTIAHEKTIYTNNSEIYTRLKSKYKEIEYRIDDIYKNIDYPYTLSDDCKIVL